MLVNGSAANLTVTIFGSKARTERARHDGGAGGYAVGFLRDYHEILRQVADRNDHPSPGLELLGLVPTERGQALRLASTLGIL
jgi:hypothetical protein